MELTYIKYLKPSKIFVSSVDTSLICLFLVKKNIYTCMKSCNLYSFEVTFRKFAKFRIIINFLQEKNKILDKVVIFLSLKIDERKY